MKNHAGLHLSSLRKSRFKFLHLFTFVIAFGVIGYCILIITKATPVINNNVHQKQDNFGQLLLQSQQLKVASKDLKVNPGKKADLQPKMQAIAAIRKNILLDLIKTNPAKARRVILPDDVLDILHTNSSQAEDHVTLTGRLGFLQIDDKNGDHIYGRLTTTDNKTYTLNTNEGFPDIKFGSMVKIPGYVIDDQILVDSAQIMSPNNVDFDLNTPASSSTSIAPVELVNSTEAAVTSGLPPIKDAVVMVNYSNSSIQIDSAKVQAVYNGTPGADIASWVNDSSYNKVAFQPAYMGPYTITSAGCGNDNGDTAAINAAKTNNDLSSYNVITIFTNCSSGGFSASCGGSCVQKYVHITNSYDIGTNAHELAHTQIASGLLLGHGGYLDCLPQTFISPTNSSFGEQPCVTGEYNDPYDVLGQSANIGQLSASHKIDAGWLDSSQFTTVTAAGTSNYSLTPYESGSGLVALKIPRGNSGSYFTVEYRQPLGFDSFINTGKCQYCNANQGALIRLGGLTFSGPGGGADSNIIDTTPGSHIDTFAYWPAYDGNDGALLPGQSFSDPDYNISIKTVSANAGSLAVQVSLGLAPCIAAAPSVSTPTPSIQTISPGQTATYSFMLTNNDSAGCPAEKFRYFPPNITNSDFFAGKMMAVSASPDYISLAPGASTIITLNATADSSAPDGSYFYSSYGAGMIFSKALGISTVTIPSPQLVVSSPADSSAPSAPSNFTAKALGSVVAKLNWTNSTDNTGVVGYKIVVNNSSIYYSTGNSIIVHDLLPSTNYSFVIQAFDHKLNYSSPVTFNLTTPVKTDFTPPQLPTIFGVTATDHSYTLTWGKASDNVGVAYFNNDGCFYDHALNCVPGDQNSETVTNQPSLNSERFDMIAYDGDGNYSYSSNAIKFSTAVQGDPAAPSTPQQLYPSYHTYGGTQLVWQPSTDDKVIAGYKVFRGCCQIAYTTTNSYFDANNHSGSAYSVQAVDSDGSVSARTYDIFTPGGGSAGSNDNTPPTVSLTSPANGSTVSGMVAFQSSSADNSGISQISYYINGYGFTSTGAAPYSASLDTTKYSDGTYWLLAIATDNNGNSAASVPISVTINNGSSSATPGDLNGDNSVNITDLSILLSNYGTSNTIADINKDGLVNVLDLSILLSNYGK